MLKNLKILELEIRNMKEINEKKSLEDKNKFEKEKSDILNENKELGELGSDYEEKIKRLVQENEKITNFTYEKENVIISLKNEKEIFLLEIEKKNQENSHINEKFINLNEKFCQLEKFYAEIQKKNEENLKIKNLSNFQKEENFIEEIKRLNEEINRYKFTAEQKDKIFSKFLF